MGVIHYHCDVILQATQSYTIITVVSFLSLEENEVKVCTIFLLVLSISVRTVVYYTSYRTHYGDWPYLDVIAIYVFFVHIWKFCLGYAEF